MSWKRKRQLWVAWILLGKEFVKRTKKMWDLNQKIKKIKTEGKQRKKYKFLSNHTKLIFGKHILMFSRDSNVMLLIYSCRGEYFKNKHVCNNVWVYVWMNFWMHAWMNVWVKVWALVVRRAWVYDWLGLSDVGAMDFFGAPTYHVRPSGWCPGR